MTYFQTARCVELSSIYYLETQIAANWTGITVVKSFTNAYKSALPVVAIELIDTDSVRREVGGTTLLNDYTIMIDIFATSNGQRIDLSDFILSKLKDGWVYYDFAQTSGDPETLSRTENGRLHVKEFLQNNKILFDENVDKYDQFRHNISILVRKD